MSLKPSLKTRSFLFGLRAPLVVNYVIYSIFFLLLDSKKFVCAVGSVNSVYYKLSFCLENGWFPSEPWLNNFAKLKLLKVFISLSLSDS